MGDTAAKAAAFAVVAACARLLPVGEFAHLGIALAALTVVTSLMDGGFSTLIVRDGARCSTDSMALLRASVRVRLPLAGLVLLAGLGVGVYLDDPWLGLTTAIAAVGSALSLTIAAVFRSVQDLAPEAIQKCAVAAATFAAATTAAAAFSRASAVVAVVGAVLWLSLAPFWLYVRRRVPDHHRPIVRRRAMRAAAPFALMALATLLYYRLGIFVLGAVGSPGATARYTVASTVAFGLLMVPNAITTGLLPRLSAPVRSQPDLLVEISDWGASPAPASSRSFASQKLRYETMDRYRKDTESGELRCQGRDGRAIHAEARHQRKCQSCVDSQGEPDLQPHGRSAPGGNQDRAEDAVDADHDRPRQQEQERLQRPLIARPEAVTQHPRCKSCGDDADEET